MNYVPFSCQSKAVYWDQNAGQNIEGSLMTGWSWLAMTRAEARRDKTRTGKAGGK